jgi:hypothetical protein
MCYWNCSKTLFLCHAVVQHCNGWKATLDKIPNSYQSTQVAAENTVNSQSLHEDYCLLLCGGFSARMGWFGADR